MRDIGGIPFLNIYMIQTSQQNLGNLGTEPDGPNPMSRALRL
jgi:hypothetical protein